MSGKVLSRGLGSGHIGQGHVVQGTHHPGDGKFTNFRSGTHMSGTHCTHRHGIKRGKVLVLLNEKDAIDTFRKIKYKSTVGMLDYSGSSYISRKSVNQVSN